MVTGILKQVNGRRYGELIKSIRAQYAFDVNVYPKMLNAAYELIENYEDEKIKCD